MSNSNEVIPIPGQPYAISYKNGEEFVAPNGQPTKIVVGIYKGEYVDENGTDYIFNNIRYLFSPTQFISDTTPSDAYFSKADIQLKPGKPRQTQQSALGKRPQDQEDQMQTSNKRPPTNLEIARDKLEKIEQKLNDPNYELSENTYKNMITALKLVPEEEHSKYTKIMEYLREEKEAEQQDARDFLNDMHNKHINKYDLSYLEDKQIERALKKVPFEEHVNWPEFTSMSAVDGGSKNKRRTRTRRTNKRKTKKAKRTRARTRRVRK